MPRLTPTTPPAADPRLSRWLLRWLALGVLVLLCVPAARDGSAWLGSSAFWCLIAPLAALVTHHRHALAAAWRAHLVRATPRRRRRRQALRRGTVSRARRGAFAPAAAGTRT